MGVNLQLVNVAAAAQVVDGVIVEPGAARELLLGDQITDQRGESGGDQLIPITVAVPENPRRSQEPEDGIDR